MKTRVPDPSKTSRLTLQNLKLWVCVATIFLISVRSVHAYIDPGTGALIWQALLAAGVGALFYIKNIWRTVGGWVRNLRQKR